MTYWCPLATQTGSGPRLGSNDSLKEWGEETKVFCVPHLPFEIHSHNHIYCRSSFLTWWKPVWRFVSDLFAIQPFGVPIRPFSLASLVGWKACGYVSLSPFQQICFILENLYICTKFLMIYLAFPPDFSLGPEGWQIPSETLEGKGGRERVRNEDRSEEVSSNRGRREFKTNVTLDRSWRRHPYGVTFPSARNIPLEFFSAPCPRPSIRSQRKTKLIKNNQYIEKSLFLPYLPLHLPPSCGPSRGNFIDF